MQMNKATRIALLIFAIAAVLRGFTALDFLSGCCVGMAVCLMMIGTMPQEKLDALKDRKWTILRRTHSRGDN